MSAVAMMLFVAYAYKEGIHSMIVRCQGTHSKLLLEQDTQVGVLKACPTSLSVVNFIKASWCHSGLCWCRLESKKPLESEERWLDQKLPAPAIRAVLWGAQAFVEFCRPQSYGSGTTCRKISNCSSLASSANVLWPFWWHSTTALKKPSTCSIMMWTTTDCRRTETRKNCLNHYLISRRSVWYQVLDRLQWYYLRWLHELWLFFSCNLESNRKPCKPVGQRSQGELEKTLRKKKVGFRLSLEIFLRWQAVLISQPADGLTKSWRFVM